MKFLAHIHYFSNGESRQDYISFNSLSELTRDIMKSKDLDVGLKMFFTSLQPEEVNSPEISDSKFIGEITREIEKDVLRIQIEVTHVDWKQFP